MNRLIPQLSLPFAFFPLHLTAAKRLHSISERITPSHRTSHASCNESPRAVVTIAREALSGLTVHITNWLQVDLEDRCTNQPTVTSFCLDVLRATAPNIDIPLASHVYPSSWRKLLESIATSCSMSQHGQARPRATEFLGLDPEIRNHIYELVYSHHKRTAKSVTVSSENGYREVPADLSRACRQIRRETLEYFYDLNLVTFAIRNLSDLYACREWLQFAPESAWSMVKAIRINHSHESTTSTLPCNLHFELVLDKVEDPVSFWGDRQLECAICYDKDGPTSLVSTIDLILKDMCASGKISSTGLELIFGLLEQATSDGG